MTSQPIESPAATYYVDEAGDGVLFARKGRLIINEPEARRFFILGMIRCAVDLDAEQKLEALRQSLLANPLYSGIASMAPEAKKTARFFHAKDDHNEVRARVYELLVKLDFKFFAVIKDMRQVLEYVKTRNQIDANYKYRPNELYDLTTRMLFKQRLHKQSTYRVTFARRGKSDRTKALKDQLTKARERFIEEHSLELENAHMEICPSYPWQSKCLQIADYALWALQRCYEKGEDRFLKAIWSKVSLIHDVDDPEGKSYGTYLTRNSPLPDVQKIKNRRI
ncbi:MAG: DUF3800 domain-containing protein [Flavobacteriaceae bacterium]